MNLSDININDLDFNDAGNWPWPVKGFAVALVFVAVVFFGYWYWVSDQFDELHQAERRETSLKREFEHKQSQAANLDAYKAQLEEMRRSFGAMLRQLPAKSEVPSLLIDISQTAQANGLTQELFKPQGEVKKEFYAELPYTIRVTGDFHQFGDFVSAVAALPRIVTLHDISIQPTAKSGKEAGSDKPLVMELTAKTYRYLEEDNGSGRGTSSKRGGRR